MVMLSFDILSLLFLLANVNDAYQLCLKITTVQLTTMVPKIKFESVSHGKDSCGKIMIGVLEILSLCNIQ